MEANQIASPEEFARLVRLVFENAMTFNIDPAHSVHQAARNLLVMFNQKYRDVDRMVQPIRRVHGDELETSKGKKKGKDDKKRKRQAEEPKPLKRQRLEEAQAMAASNASAVAAVVAAAPATSAASVSRAEFNMLLHVIQQLQQQVVKTHTLLAELTPEDLMSTTAPTASAAPRGPAATAPKTSAPAPAPERKKSKRPMKTEEPVMMDDSQPLSLEEQELLTETINELPQEHLGGVIQIIREAAPVGADEEEIDLEIDQLDTKTQRKLFRFVSKVSLSMLVFFVSLSVGKETNTLVCLDAVYQEKEEEKDGD
jgi:hypothetical protein